MKTTLSRAGRYVRQPTGYSAFVPNPLPPEPPIEMDAELLACLSAADRAVGALDGIAQALPDADLFTMMFVRKEAVLSSQIEGTQSSLAEVLELEAKVFDPGAKTDAGDVLNYVRAMNYAVERLNTLPLSLRLVREIHRELMEGTRGQEREPGEFRRSQNWIGPAGCTLTTARFVPPAPDEMKTALADWESFLHQDRNMPVLLKIGLLHSQFETIHPFLDGNGRVGRLLITLFLAERGLLKKPVLYLSHYFRLNLWEYYDRLQAVRDSGDLEGWLKFFLRGVAIVAAEAAVLAHKIVELRQEQRQTITASLGRSAADGLRLHDALFSHPYVTIASVQELMGQSFPTANRLTKKMVDAGILTETTGRRRGQVFVYRAYLDLLQA